MSESSDTLETKNDQKSPTTRTAVGVRFRSCGKIYTFEIGNIDIAPGTKVVIESELGISLGTVAKPKHDVRTPKEPLKKVLRIASESDLAKVEENRSLEEEARAFCIEKVKEYKLQMKIVTSDITLDRKKLVFYFTADSRIDFRELVRDLASKFKTRIEMRQIGVRDEVKIIGGLGACGRQACCNLFLTNFIPVTIKMAKQQALSINQSKLSGICGRLMCCLGYEQKAYEGKRSFDKKKGKRAGDSTVSEEAAAPAERPELQKGAPEPPSGAELPSTKEETMPSDQTKGDDKKQRIGRKRRRRRPGAAGSGRDSQGGTQKETVTGSEKPAGGESKKTGVRTFNKKRRRRKKPRPVNKNEPEKK